MKTYKNIKNIKLSLMKKTSSKEILDKDKNNFIISASGKLNVSKLLEIQKHKFKKEDFDDFMSEFDDFMGEALSLIYKELWSHIKEKDKNKIETVGLWINFNDKSIDNSIDINILKDIKKYGEKNINPILEFYKMTIKTS